MYLVLYPQPSQFGNDSDGFFNAVYTDDMQRIGTILSKEKKVRVYKLSSLTEIVEMKVTCEEVPKELA